jgi:hypothetical protein
MNAFNKYYVDGKKKKIKLSPESGLYYIVVSNHE